MSEVRRFDSLEKTVRDTARKLEDLRSTTLNRLATHTHDVAGSSVGTFDYLILTDQTTGSKYYVYVDNGELLAAPV